MSDKHFLIEDINLMSEWDFDKNNEIGLNPNSLSFSSSKKAFWKCDNNHIYQTSIKDKVRRNQKCPICQNKIVAKGINDFENNFVCFGFEKGGFNYDWKFISTEYDDLMMIRCKFDSYALTQFNTDIEGNDLSMSELFDYKINVWTSDYDNETPLLTINWKTAFGFYPKAVF